MLLSGYATVAGDYVGIRKTTEEKRLESITLTTSLFLIFLALCGGYSIVRELLRF
jgi:hypothetical protein